eukprot:1155728-Prorocentrum_lima.AAC.1
MKRRTTSRAPPEEDPRRDHSENMPYEFVKQYEFAIEYDCTTLAVAAVRVGSEVGTNFSLCEPSLRVCGTFAQSVGSDMSLDVSDVTRRRTCLQTSQM